jgi:acetyltransferase-like isoleucine patch superfamily enzyme
MNSAWRGTLNRWRRRIAHALLHRVVFGETSGGRYLPNTRIAPSTCIEHEDRLQLGDHVFIGAFNFIEASGGVTVGEGVQITHHVGIVTHSSHRAQRLLGRAYAAWPASATEPRPGWIAGPVHIGPYCFIGPQVLIEAGTRLGRGCIVSAGSVLRGDFPAFSRIAGNPAQVVGDSRDGDARWLAGQPALRAHYDAWAAVADPAGGFGHAASAASAAAASDANADANADATRPASGPRP